MALSCRWQGLSLVISTALTISPETVNSKKPSPSHEVSVWCMYIHVQGAPEQRGASQVPRCSHHCQPKTPGILQLSDSI